jgi:hypothetical protein
MPLICETVRLSEDRKELVRKGPAKGFKLQGQIKDQRVKVMISNERSCQKEYTYMKYESPSTNQSKVITKV